MASQPHIILLMADQLRFDCLSAYGNLPVETPNLDQLASKSVIMDNAYCATPLCGPTRTSMYTGKYPHQHGAIVNQPSEYNRASPEHQTLYEILDKGGYGITHVGVQHCRTEPSLEKRIPDALIENEKEWQENCPVESDRSHTLPYVPYKMGTVNGKNVTGEFSPPRKILNAYPLDKFRDVWWAQRIIEQIQKIDFESPQYIEALFWAPHLPFDLPEPYFSMYPAESIELSQTVGRWYPGHPIKMLDQISGHMGRAALRDEYRNVWSAYFGLVTLMDDCVGKVIQALKDKGVWDDSVVVFTVDHGEMLGEHCLVGKSCYYESASHIPMFIKTPSGQTGRCRDFVSAIDYCATVCDYAGLEPPRGNEGLSLKEMVENKTSINRDCVFMEYNGDQCGPDNPTRAIVTSIDGIKWKYVYTKGDVDELYNLSEDPDEVRSLVDYQPSPDIYIYRESMKDLKPVSQEKLQKYKELRNKLRKRLFEWMRETDDIIQPPKL